MAGPTRAEAAEDRRGVGSLHSYGGRRGCALRIAHADGGGEACKRAHTAARGGGRTGGATMPCRRQPVSVCFRGAVPEDPEQQQQFLDSVKSACRRAIPRSCRRFASAPVLRVKPACRSRRRRPPARSAARSLKRRGHIRLRGPVASSPRWHRHCLRGRRVRRAGAGSEGETGPAPDDESGVGRPARPNEGRPLRGSRRRSPEKLESIRRLK